MKFNRKDLLLYGVTHRGWLGEDSLGVQVEKALKGGVTFLQLREKDRSDADYLEEARRIRDLCAQYHVPLIINDNVDIALAADADGVHVGQKDMEAGYVRDRLGPDKILGVSARTVEQALLAERRGADYLGVGAVFGTSTKEDAVSVSFDTLKAICQAVSIPVVAIGGISLENAEKLKGSGIAGAAVVSAIFGAGDIELASRLLKNKLEGLVGI